LSSERKSEMSVRLINIAEVEVGMVTLERSGRGIVTRSHPAYGENGWYYSYDLLEGEWKGTEGSHKGVLDNTVWIEEETQ
jgi:hypothetical protein